MSTANHRLITRLLEGEAESECVEFKHNNENPETIGQNISALSNSAALHGSPRAFVLWGVEDASKKIVGTTFSPVKAKVGNESLQNWLTRLLDPQVEFKFEKLLYENRDVVLLSINSAPGVPVRFSGTTYIRVGSHTKRLKEHRGVEKRLWQELNATHFEQLPAKVDIGESEVLALLDYPEFFAKSNTPLPESRKEILVALVGQGMISYSVNDGWTITNLGAALLARDFKEFPSIRRKAIRIIKYVGSNKYETERETLVKGGYAAGFDELIQTVMALLPAKETISNGLRTTTAFPELAVRELIANAIIHQDFSITGAGPMVEIFEDRLEISNPGDPIIPKDRFVNALPQSRNERLAGAMHLFHIAEERGSGWDKIAFEVEFHQLPAPLIEVGNGGTRVVVYGPRPLDKMDKDDRVRAVYLHACLQYANREPTTNASVRRRFGLESHSNATASRMIKDAVEAGVIIAYDPTVGTRAMRYVPSWVRLLEEGDQ